MINNVVAQETWKNVPGYEGYYKVSDKGRVLSLVGWNGHRYVKRKRIIKGWVQLTEVGGTYKRRVVKLTKDGKGEEIKVHRLVADAFLENLENKPEVNHIDGNPLNNNLENLEWVTSGENKEHAIATGLRRVEAYKNVEMVLSMYEKGDSVKTISEKFNASNLTINKIIEGSGMKIRDSGFYQNKYDIDREELVKDFERGLSNKEIAKKHGTNNRLIATYKYKHKKGELKI